MRLVVTGSAGSLAGDVIPGLLRDGFDIHGIDRVESTIGSARQHEGQGRFSQTVLDLSNPEDLEHHFIGADAIIHLAGIPLEDEWGNLSQANVNATFTVLRTALKCDIRRVAVASSIHAAGLTPIPPSGHRLKASIPVLPNTLYGVSKAAVESLGMYFAHQHGLEVVNLRICSRLTKPSSERHLSTWLSPSDAVRLCSASVRSTLPEPYWTVWGVSQNSRTWFDMSAGHAIGFYPQDDAEMYADTVSTPAASTTLISITTIGGEFSSHDPPSMTKGGNHGAE